MRVIRIAYVSSGQKSYVSFSFDSFSLIKSKENSVFLYFDSLSDDLIVSGDRYYGTRVEFLKTGFGSQLYGEIFSRLFFTNSQISTLDYTEDPLTTILFSSVYSPSGGGGGGAGPTGSTGAQGTTGSTGPGTSVIKKNNVDLLVSGWSLVSGLYEYTLNDLDIQVSSVVDYTPYNSSVDTVVAAFMLPYMEVQNGFTVFYAKNLPEFDISGQLIIIG